MKPYPQTFEDFDAAVSDIKAQGASKQDVQDFSNEWKFRMERAGKNPAQMYSGWLAQKSAPTAALPGDIAKERGITTKTGPDAGAGAVMEDSLVNAKAPEGIMGALPRAAGSLIEGAQKGYQEGQQNWQDMKGSMLPDKIVAGARMGLDPVAGAINGGIEGLGKEVVAPVLDKAESGLESVFGKPNSDVKMPGQGLDDPNGLWEKAKQEFHALPDDAKKTMGNFGGALKDVFDIFTSGVVGGTAEKVGEKALETVGEKVAPVLEKGGQMVQEGVQAGKQLAGDALNKFKSVLKTSTNPAGDITNALDQRTIDIVQAEALAKEFGVELPASSFAEPAKARTEQIVAEGFFGGEIKKKAEKAVEDFSKKVSDIQAEAPTSGELGENIVNKFKKVETERKAVIDDLYSQASELTKKAGGKLVIDTPKSQKALDELITRKQTALKAGVGNPVEIKKLTTLRNGIANNYELETQRAALKEIGDMANFDSFAPTTDEKVFRSLYHSLKNDIDESISRQAPEIGKTLKKANTAFKEFQDLKDRPFAKSIEKMGKSGDVDTLADKLTRTNVSTNEITQIYSTLGEETKAQIQKKIISDIAEKARGASGEGFTPTGFSRQIQKIGEERLASLLEPEQVKLLHNLDKINQLIAKGSQVARGSQTALLQQVIRVLSAPATGGMSVVGEWILSKLIGTKAGQNFLKGVDKKTVQALEAAAQQQ